MNKSIPDKLYFKIGEVAKMAEVPTHVIRYWESEFTSIKPKRAHSKQRLFRRQDVELILKIKQLLHHEGYTIAGARKLLMSGDKVERNATPEKATRKHPSLVEKLQSLKHGLQEVQAIISRKK